MIKKFVTLLLIYVVVFSTGSSALAQTKNQLTENANTAAAKSDLRAFFANERRKSNDSTMTTADIEKLEKDSIKRQMKNNLSSKQKTWIWIGVGAAVAITVLILVTRNDDDRIIRIPDCNLGPC